MLRNEMNVQSSRGEKVTSKEARELEARMARMKELEKMLRKVELQVQLMEGGAMRKIRRNDDDNYDEESTPVYKWKPRQH